MLPTLGEKTREELGASRKFLMAAYRIHSAINEIVENLDDVELIAMQMWKQSLSHWYVNKPNFRQHQRRTENCLEDLVRSGREHEGEDGCY